MTEPEESPEDPPDDPPQVSNEANGPVDGFLFQAGAVHGDVNNYFYGQPTPPPSSRSDDAFGALVNALLEVPSVRDEPSRRLTLSRMRREIADAVPQQQTARMQVISLVQTCLNYDDGLGDLLRVIRELEGESIPVRRSAEAARTLLEENR
ncbi:hypothetical protein [Lentzea sp. NPDC051838]|uniref:effector-associated domain 2-containing protein n=1 Tax=Lentzea sp. NPDC051838 TaxID=3154849 RepID=UPI00341C768C